MIGIFKPAPAIDQMPKERSDKLYPRWRLKMFLVAYIGYFTYYFGRSSFSVAKQYLVGFNTEQMGLIGASLGVAYGLSKFLMGNVSDRSNPRYFLSTGLILSGIINIIIPGMLGYGVSALVFIMFINGWVQGMGWPPCGRIMTHWFSDGERGTKMGIWNTAHNVGAGFLPLIIVPIGIFLWGGNWFGLFYFAGIICIAVGILIIIFGGDTPQSVGLPPIEEYTNDYPLEDVEKDLDNREQEMTSKQIFFKYVLCNKWLWMIAIANVFVYCVRYGLLNWSSYYLSDVKGMSKAGGLLGFALFELPAIPGTILIGWITDRYFKGKRAPMGVICMALVFVGIIFYWKATSPIALLSSLACIGFLIYGPVALIGILALDLVPKKAAGTAAGFTGLFGYFLGTVGAEAVLGFIAQKWGWNVVFITLLVACALSVIMLAFSWNLHDRSKSHSSH